MIIPSVLFALAVMAWTSDSNEPLFSTQLIHFDGRILDRRFVDVDGDGVKELVVAIRTRAVRGDRRELLIHRLRNGQVSTEADHVIPVKDDVIAYGFADVRSEPGRELIFLTPGGAWSYSTTIDGYRDVDGSLNIQRLVDTELFFDVADPDSLPSWLYVLEDSTPHRLLLPERGGYAIFTAEEVDQPLTGVARFHGNDHATPFDTATAINSRTGSGVHIRFDDDSVFLNERLSGMSSLLSTDSDYRSPALVDVNGDGRTDLVARSDGGLRIHLDDGDGIPVEPTRIEKLPDYLKRDNTDLKQMLRDIDGDGDVDIIAQLDDDRDGLDSGVSRIVVLINNGGQLYPPKQDQLLRFEGTAVTALVTDVDGDGRSDLVVTKYETPSLTGIATGFELRRSAFLYLGRGDLPFQKSPALRDEQVFDVDALQDAIVQRHLKSDFSGDGIADLVEVDLSGRVAVRRVVFSSSFFGGDSWSIESSPWKRFDVRGSMRNLAVDDINGDGVGDIVTHKDNTITLVLSRKRG
jgi:hypothetical protein